MAKTPQDKRTDVQEFDLGGSKKQGSDFYLYSFNAWVQIVGYAEFGARRIVVPGSQIQFIEHRDGDDPPSARKFPIFYPTQELVITKALISNFLPDPLLEWKLKVDKEGIINNQNKKTIIVSFKISGAPADKTYIFYGAWPTNISISDLDAMSSEIVMQTITIAYDKMEINTD